MFMVPGVDDWRAEDMSRFNMASIVDNYATMDEGFSFILIHDSASGSIDFSESHCIFPFRSSAFHEPTLARQYVYTRLRVLKYSLFRLDIEALSIRIRMSTFIFKVSNLVPSLKKYIKLIVIRI
jgi:hypothetical protein